MRTTLSLIGVSLLVGTGLVLAVAASPLATQAPPAAPASPAATAAPANPQEAPLRELHSAFVKAYNAADAKALSELFTADAELINSDGEVTRGRAAIAAMYAGAFKEAKGVK